MKQKMINKVSEYRKNTRRGVALIEAMISIIVLAIGVLGVLGLQLRTMVESQQSANRALAVRLAEDFSERVKNNSGAENLLARNVSLGENNFVTGNPPAWVSEISSLVTTDPGNNCTGAAGCTDAQLAAWDRFQWLGAVTSTLPNAQINVFMSTNEQIGILFAWDGNMRVAAGEMDENGVNYGINYRAIYDVAVNVYDATLPAGPVNCASAGGTGLVCHLVYISY